MRAAVLFLPLIAACSSGPAPVALEAFCDAEWRAITARQAECGCATADAAAVVAAECAMWPPAALTASIASGEAQWDASRAGAAVAVARSFDCAVADGWLDPSTAPVVGTLPDGSPCADFEEAGTPCAGGVCRLGRCYHRALPGEACDPGTATPEVYGVCTGDARCAATDPARGVCRTFGVGDACMPGGTFRACDEGACSAGVCAAPEPGGSDCRTNDECDSGACVGTFCLARVGLGEVCTPGSSGLDCLDRTTGRVCSDGCVDPYPTCYRPCADGLRCAGGTCAPLAAPGEACTGNGECTTGRCAGGTCRLAACP
jgi:hypothetical protein